MAADVSARFSKFIGNLTLTETQRNDGAARRSAVVKSLNLHYYGSSNATDHSIYIGSWGKRTRIRPPRDVDVLFRLPYSTYERFEKRTGNKQSALLQEVKSVLLRSFPNTAIRGDGPAVVVPFSSYNVELIPGFKLKGTGDWICMTDNGGSYKTAGYDAEATHISESNTKTNGNTRDLIKMIKCWQGHCNVPLKSFWIELISVSFLNQWEYAGKSKTYYDWMVRDFFEYLVSQSSTYIYAPGTYEAMYIGSAWLSKANTAKSHAVNACDHDAGDRPNSAGEEWRKIFGNDMPSVP